MPVLPQPDASPPSRLGGAGPSLPPLRSLAKVHAPVGSNCDNMRRAPKIVEFYQPLMNPREARQMESQGPKASSGQWVEGHEERTDHGNHQELQGVARQDSTACSRFARQACVVELLDKVFPPGKVTLLAL
ncbi:uncharacterized protein LOC133911278 [Phragmites australis]|uniref:uncharacterized protein LOC133911278 n=1 Tax=Phragmites australis TaxID=29695 RepID=UPI002D79F8D0|nr:uncharacterized protein LOC133911278 [Phragmites australis]